MNKSGFVKQISKELNVDESRARQIADLLEENFLIGKKNKENTIQLFADNLKVTEEEANEIYDKCIDVIKNNLVQKVKHPFKNLDKED